MLELNKTSFYNLKTKSQTVSVTYPRSHSSYRLETKSSYFQYCIHELLSFKWVPENKVTNYNLALTVVKIYTNFWIFFLHYSYEFKISRLKTWIKQIWILADRLIFLVIFEMTFISSLPLSIFQRWQMKRQNVVTNYRKRLI